jgi:uncharacterized protein YfaS (alpha-2-macroglobulin family)
MIRLNDQNNIFDLYKKIASSLNSEEWMNTQTTSFALIAVSKTMEKMNADRKGLSYSISSNHAASRNIKTSALFSTAFSSDLSDNQQVTLKNTSGAPVYVNYYTEGIPKASQSEKTDRNLETNVKFLTKDHSPVDITQLKQGTDFMAVMKVLNSTTEDVSECALTFQVPSGWEIRNTRMFNQTTSTSESSFDYRDFRDDKVLTYFNLKKGESKTFLIILNASYLGKYYFPNIQTEAMYDKNYFSLIPGLWVEVSK